MRPDEKHGKNWRKLGRHFTREQPPHKLHLEDYLDSIPPIDARIAQLPPVWEGDTIGDSSVATVAHMLHYTHTVSPFFPELTNEEIREAYKAMTGFDPRLPED